MQTQTNQRQLALLALFSCAVLTACGPELGGPDDGDCGGKCDGRLASRFVDLFRDPSTFEPGDLSKWSADFVTERINSAINISLVSIPGGGSASFSRPRLAKTDIYALEERAGHSFTFKSLKSLTAGLTRSYGEQEYFTRINALRAQFLERNPRAVWAEARFELPTNLRLGFNVDGIGINFGFTGLDHGVSATVITPYDADDATDLARALVQAPSDATRAALGASWLGKLTHFHGLPDSLDDFRAMKPGQLIALHTNHGVSGFTFNAATPVYIASISEATLHARISAAAHVIATGELDVQMVRDTNDTLVVDVGITEHGSDSAPNMHFRLAIDGYWGFQAFTAGAINIGPLTLDVAKIANDEVRKQLNARFQPFKAAIEWNPAVKTRNVITRLAFDLSAQGAKRAKLERALRLASHGVLWYAQLLAAKPDSGVTTLLDVDRIARRPSFYVGLQLPVLGMSFHYERRSNVGNATITADGVTQQLFWDQLERNSGWFWNDRDQKVAGIASVKTDAATGRPIGADYNLRLILAEDSSRAFRDEIVDQVDPLLALFVGNEGLLALSKHTDALERHVDSEAGCGSYMSGPPNDVDYYNEVWERCLMSRPNDAGAQQQKQNARALFNGMVAGGKIRGQLDGRHTSAATFAQRLLELKLAAQSLPESNELNPPNAAIKVQTRISKRGIERILGAPNAKATFEARLSEIVDMVNVRRQAERPQSCWTHDDGREICSDNPRSYAEQIARVGGEFQRQVRKFNKLAALSSVPFLAASGALTQMGDHGAVVDIDSHGRLVEPESEEDQARSAIGERKAAALRKFFEKMVDKAEPGFPVLGRLFGEGLGGRTPGSRGTERKVIAYALMQLAGPDELELLVQADFSDELEYNGHKVVDLPELRLYGRGANVQLIDAGRFGLEALMGH